MYECDLDDKYETSHFNERCFNGQLHYFLIITIFKLKLYIFCMYECDVDHKYEKS